MRTYQRSQTYRLDTVWAPLFKNAINKEMADIWFQLYKIPTEQQRMMICHYRVISAYEKLCLPDKTLFTDEFDITNSKCNYVEKDGVNVIQVELEVRSKSDPRVESTIRHWWCSSTIKS